MASHSGSSNPIHFFKIILKSSLQSIRIPNKFTGRYGGGLPNPVFLKPPDGKEWRIYWTKHDNGFWLQNGWEEFASFYSLNMGHLVLFKYEGTSQFVVHIFDQSATEIEYPSHDTLGQKDNLTKISDENIVEVLDDMPSSKKVGPKVPRSSPRPHKKMRTATHEDVEKRTSNLQNFHVGVKSRSGQPQGTESQKSTNEELKACKQESEEDMGGRTLTKNKCLNWEDERRMDSLTALKKTRASKRARTFRSQNPSFRVVMRPSYVNYRFRLHLPLEFFKTYLQKKNNTARVKLLVEDGVWSVRYMSRRAGKQYVLELHYGWKKFVEDNDLKVGDVCLFELIQRTKPTTLQVTIFRASKGSVHSNDSDPGNGEKGVKLEGFLDQGGKPTQSTSLLSRPQESRTLAEAGRFSSKNPFFTIHIRAGHLYVPKSFHRYIKKTNVIMIQMEKTSWPVNIVFYADSTRSESARFSGGWFSFARESGLQVGDICIFELIERGKDQVLQLHVFRSPSK
ncbi:B3 domain-containing transcription factor VRN1-like isoform X2 [Senna tora]|uniref:B3 domain-containing transcription factor VRN1-like isoform X2 n=1 Tax=Senna tora TaxID=362788 RepID=A0A834SJI8_9FABA|nr:B3 domain-containing transcription factor VRN1-like isoform X2 [Senna tora]